MGSCAVGGAGVGGGWRSGIVQGGFPCCWVYLKRFYVVFFFFLVVVSRRRAERKGFSRAGRREMVGAVGN